MEITTRPSVQRYSPKTMVEKPSPRAIQKAEESFVPSGEPSVEEVAGRYHRAWAERMKEPKCEIGILCERSWSPASEDDPVLQIADAIMDSGGKPRLLFVGEPVENQMAGLGGLAIPGGRDVDPKFYGQVMGPGMANSQPDPEFDKFEIECIQKAFDTRMPMLGHCRGEQIMNVAAGGSLVQDIPTEFHSPEGWGSKYGTRIDHRPPENSTFEKRPDPVHLLVVEEGTRLHDIVGDSLEFVNSVHHQAIARVAPILTAVAWSPDGLVEGVERTGMPWQSAYQFHPEALRHTDGAFQKLYQNLVDDGVRFQNGEL